jgi:hypothetical protein
MQPPTTPEPNPLRRVRARFVVQPDGTTAPQYVPHPAELSAATVLALVISLVCEVRR